MPPITKEKKSVVKPEGWDQYAYFSDNAMRDRVPQTKKFQQEESIKNIDYKAIRKAEEGETGLADKGWDKYFFFGCPGDKSKITPAARKGRMRPAAEGPRTFNMEESVLDDDGRKLNATSYAQSFQQVVKPDTYETKPSIVPHIFPNGHQTFNQLFAQHRTDMSKEACYTIL